ncbi:hypothetical protein CTAYLR_000258 [Chrysophaeum taylorii]|uniref:Uncharacterized protein n=1 Tax=Chrysophaeum taylorii TaxID=2483200 RepID=A0AAD7UEM7_9STRA|nr:hypothetical protein CTAYLR_000258 [Chrysophaeum taylorii]
MERSSSKMVIRLLMIGDSSVGKTSLVIRYDEDTFSTKYMTTIGVDYRDKFIEVDGRPIKLQIWDTAGQERFRSLTANFFGKADGFVVCFDVSNRTSFGHIRNWISDVQQHKRGEVDVALCGCKCDVEARVREVSEQEARGLADEFKVPYYEASAKMNTNVAQTFEELAEKVVRRKLASGATGGSSPNLVIRSPDAPEKKSCSC